MIIGETECESVNWTEQVQDSFQERNYSKHEDEFWF